MNVIGIFSNEVIVATSPPGGAFGLKGIWRVAANGTKTLLARIDTLHFEGVTVIPNNTNQWSPWQERLSRVTSRNLSSILSD